MTTTTCIAYAVFGAICAAIGYLVADFIGYMQY